MRAGNSCKGCDSSPGLLLLLCTCRMGNGEQDRHAQQEHSHRDVVCGAVAGALPYHTVSDTQENSVAMPCTPSRGPSLWGTRPHGTGTAAAYRWRHARWQTPVCRLYCTLFLAKRQWYLSGACECLKRAQEEEEDAGAAAPPALKKLPAPHPSLLSPLLVLVWA